MMTSDKDDKTKAPSTTNSHVILCPAVTDDYRLSLTKNGYRIVANRRIKKGEIVLPESYEFAFSDVRDGDRMYLSNLDEANELAAKHDDEELLPTHIPVTRDMLLRTHGVPSVTEKSDEEVVVRQLLESPGMFMNHSCDPNILQSPTLDGEDYAIRDIEEGEELFVDYYLAHYDHGPWFDPCWCGAANCRGNFLGFKSLGDDEKKRLLPKVVESVKAMYMADLGEGPKIRHDNHVVPREQKQQNDAAEEQQIMRLEFPGPCATIENAVVKSDGKEYGLYAAKDISKGELFLEYWWLEWPQQQNGQEAALIDMVFASRLSQDNPEEGTIIRFDPSKCRAFRNEKGGLMFSGWEMLSSHACSPNVVYRNKKKSEEDDWQVVYAAKDIKKGDRITMDFNCFTWDRSSACGNDTDCHCGASNCAGTVQGFKFLSPEAKKERRSMTWLRKAMAEEDESNGPRDRALSPYVRKCLGEQDEALMQNGKLAEQQAVSPASVPDAWVEQFSHLATQA